MVSPTWRSLCGGSSLDPNFVLFVAVIAVMLTRQQQQNDDSS